MGCGGFNRKKDRKYVIRMARRFTSVSGEVQHVFFKDTVEGVVYDFEPVNERRGNVVYVVRV